MYSKHYVVNWVENETKYHKSFEAGKGQDCSDFVFDLAHNKDVKKITKLTVEQYESEEE